MMYVVVIFGSPAEGWCDLNHCPMETIGPFKWRDEANAEAARYPNAFRPHVLLLREPGSEAQSRPAPPERAWERRHAAGEYPWQEKLTEEETCD